MSVMEHLPSINWRIETLRLCFGSVIRLCLHSFLHYVSCSLVSRYVLRRNSSYLRRGRQLLPHLASLGLEIGVSLLICPVRYLAAVNTPRFILDYTLTGWSEVLRLLDRFSPGNFASYALYAFSSDAEWNFNFFLWQMPSVGLTLTKLWYRRRNLGSKRCRTKRVFSMLSLQLLLRAYLSTFSVMIPESAVEVIESIVSVVLESTVTSYLALHTWPFVGALDSLQSSVSENSNSHEIGSEESHPNK